MMQIFVNRINYEMTVTDDWQWWNFCSVTVYRQEKLQRICSWWWM